MAEHSIPDRGGPPADADRSRRADGERAVNLPTLKCDEDMLRSVGFDILRLREAAAESERQTSPHPPFIEFTSQLVKVSVDAVLGPAGILHKLFTTNQRVFAEGGLVDLSRAVPLGAELPLPGETILSLSEVAALNRRKDETPFTPDQMKALDVRIEQKTVSMFRRAARDMRRL